MADFLERLLNGMDPKTVPIVQSTLGLSDEQMNKLRVALGTQLALPIPYQFLPLQDCINMATFLVMTTSVILDWVVGIRGVGGEIDVATITREGLRFITERKLHPWGE